MLVCTYLAFGLVWKNPKGFLISTKFRGSSCHFHFGHFYIEAQICTFEDSMFRENPAFHIWTKGWHQPQSQGLACSWWGLGPEGSALDCSAPEGSVGLGVTAFSHHRPTRGQACTLKVKYTIQNTLNQSIVWSWYFGIMILLHFASPQTKRLHAGRQGPCLSFWCWDEGPLRGSYNKTAMLSTCWVNYTLLN